MMKAVYFLSFLVMISMCTRCKTAQASLRMDSIENYSEQESEQILFLNFSITSRDKASKEQVKLTKSVLGSGKLKMGFEKGHGLYQLKVVPVYDRSRPASEQYFEHPLYRLAEHSDAQGKLSKTQLYEQQGTVSLRIMKDKDLERLDMYSITPERGTQLIYKLNLKQ